MVKKRVRKRATSDGASNHRVRISFIGDVIDRAVADLERHLERLPSDAREPRQAVRFAIAGLKFVASTTKMRCRSWYMAPR